MSGDAPTDDIQQMLALAIAGTERGEYQSALPILKRVYELVPPASAPQGLSSLGLCIAKVEKKNKLGAELCQKAIDLQFYEGRHWANLVRVHIAGKSRRKAVQILEEGLRKMRNDKELLRVRNEIGYRKAPYFRFLKRQNPVNKVYSQTANRVRSRATIIIIVIGSVIYVAFLVAMFFAILK